MAALWIVGLLIVASAASHANAVSCPQALAMLLPCKDYLVGQSPTLTAPCCQAASQLNGMVHSKPELRDLCSYLKQAAASLHVIADRAKSLPQNCHIQVPVPIDPNVDCSRI
ncbi:non-specific lipid-transfer protein 1-like [Salvia miltiorrhiza]|uniref:non-specific lipid-transfer protein 1-like n=1 Tax=Salvia miltiorrhiza TaxID=226208 RepID=UPI0025AB7EF4|nr:non-specific lipid-transfer protein 1-like [Salvia miltiorrhiza]